MTIENTVLLNISYIDIKHFVEKLRMGRCGVDCSDFGQREGIGLLWIR